MIKDENMYTGFSKWFPKFSIIVLFTLLLSGCFTTNTDNSSDNISPKAPTNLGQEVNVTITHIAGEPFNMGSNVEVFVENEQNIIITTAGSGSCPPVIEHVYVDNNVIKLVEKQYHDTPCTMDYRLYPQRIVTVDVGNVFLDKDFMLCKSDVQCVLIVSRTSWEPEQV